ncbi:hypothetical protein D8674_017499 [Pyrus ussuriensis x Pyrus communis]|uniref:Ubiquitin-like protease family profile domain-containing protein n=1 Tax=Pyrus ussuriensis x Pyrus communis TaxID=2448454 RepID=A0A5N5HCW1_9ROSA|nr:hypothetical protein D8674_017499 [Pyrus ussuriensis x Pyrus communis]
MVYMPLNLDHHWVAIKMNFNASRIIVYDSLRSTTHTRKSTMKLASIFYVLPNVLRSMSREVEDGPWPIIVSQRALQQNNG